MAKKQVVSRSFKTFEAECQGCDLMWSGVNRADRDRQRASARSHARSTGHTVQWQASSVGEYIPYAEQDGEAG